MAQRDQLEVVSPTGDLLFFDLDERDGVTNVGRHPSNDVVLNGQGIADFHLVIDHRTTPYQVSVINPGVEATVGNQPMEPNRTYTLQAWDTIFLAGFAMILVEGNGGGTSVPVASPTRPTRGAQPPFLTSPTPAFTPPSPAPSPSFAGPSAFSGTPAPGVTPPFVTPSPSPVIGSAAPPLIAQPAPAAVVQAPMVTAPTAVGPGGVAGGPPVITPSGGRPLDGQNAQAVQAPVQSLSDMIDESIVLEVSTREVVINVEETATWQLTIANGGNLVARFEVHIEGWIDGSWVTVEPGFVNLFEGGRSTVNVNITPPRLPTSRAGTHQLAVVVTSPNYPGLRAQRAITLVINPYYEFHVGDVSPRQQSVNYFRRTALLRLPVENKGNSELGFRLEGTDDENLVTFEMDSPTEATRLVRQVEFSLAPNQSVTLPVSATPRNHQFIGVVAHQHSLTLTTTMLSPQPASRSVLAQIRNRPIVGPWLIFALGILLAAIIIIALQPRIESFDFAPGVVQTTVEGTADPALTAQGAAAQATALQGKSFFGIKLPKLPKLPKQLAFLNDLWPGGGTEDGAEVAVAPPLAAAMVNAGNEVTLTWETRRATSVTIEKIVGGETQFVATIENPSQQRQYTFAADTRERATYVLTARNWIERLPVVGETFGLDDASLGLIVDPVQPVIEVFEVAPPGLVTGQTVNISWQVARAQDYELLVNGVPRPLESARGTMQEIPNTTTEYQLVARSPYWDEPVSSSRKVVAVSLPTPVINNFDIEPKPVVDGDLVRIAWDVAGASSVTIDPLVGDVANMQGQDEGVLELGRTQQTFTLLATLGDGEEQVRAIATRVIDIVPPTPTPTLTPTATPTTTPLPPTATPIPPPLIRSFDISPRPIVDGQSVQLNWLVEGASAVEIAPAVGAVNSEGPIELTVVPGKSQEIFTLRAVMDNGISTVVAIATRVIPIVTPTPTITPTPTQTPTQTPQMPVIQVFTLLPREVVRGDAVSSTGTDAEGQPIGGTTSNLPELTWTVVGDATMVEVTAPDFGPVRNLPKQGTLRVPADKTTVFQLNVYLGDEIVASLTQELTVLEPTPTPTVPPPPTPLPTNTPTPTPTPTPNIVSFTVNAVQDGDVVVPIAAEDNIPTYEVTAGTLIRLAWRIENPVTEVRLTDSSNDYGARSPEDEFQVTITQSTIFQLTVTGSVSRRIRINVQAIAPPPPPFNVNGINGNTVGDPATVTWDYPGESQARILGFRIYRANVDNFNFSLVADRFELDNTIKEWVDPSLPSCDRVYYVVGVYEDITRTGDDRIQETTISPTSWYTRPCE